MLKKSCQTRPFTSTQSRAVILLFLPLLFCQQSSAPQSARKIGRRFRIGFCQHAALQGPQTRLQPPQAALQTNLGNGWEEIELEGSWFIDSFGYRMRQFQREVTGEEKTLISSVEDAWHTMALVETAYESSAKPATKIPTSINSIKF